MKKVILSIAIFFSFNSAGQSLDTVTVNLTLRAADWAFIAGSTQPQDSFNMVHYRRIRDTIRLANPANYNTNIRVNSIPGKIVFDFYRLVKGQPETLYEQVGGNISTQIKAIVNTTLQTFITAFDAVANNQYLIIRTKGKNIVMDN